ncbi:MAG: YceI family protein [Chitinophagia bacterium]|jgi:polyisoprenoid-binding protein YceI|nr:YceI family protein [Chitinophagia bacterium]NCA30313.1 YceI family protein [Chitinophagia bacterium]
MKKIMFSLVVIAASISMISFAPKAKNSDVVNFTVTAQKSKIDFTGSKKSDYHTGYFPIKSGAVQVNGGKLVGGNFVIDIAGLKVTDAGGGEKLQGHLSSADFFDISKFGEASFTISSVEYTKADRATIKGDLNLKGIKAPITFSAVIRNADDKGFFAEAFMPFDRTLFGINYGIGMIDSEVQLAIHIYGTK